MMNSTIEKCYYLKQIMVMVFNRHVCEILRTKIVGYFDWEVHGSMRNGINGRSTLLEKLAIASGSRMEVGI